jgi:hypothetical protein
MIKPNNSGSVSIPATTADGVWVTSINVMSPTPNRPITAQIRVAPYNSTSGSVYRNLERPIAIQNVMSHSMAQNELNNAMGAILTAVQALVISGSVFN